MKILFSAVFALTWGLILPPTAVACSCDGPADPCLAVTAADLVFVGRAVAIEPGSLEPPNRRPAMVRFDVAEVLHGTVPKAVELRNGGGASCIFSFAADRDYVVYARYRDGAFEAFLCSRTGELADRRHDVDILRQRSRGTPVPRVAGRITEGRQLVDGSLGVELLPLGGVTVTAQRGTAVRRAVTDADGRFVFMNIPAGDYKVTADLPRAYDQVVGQDATVKVELLRRGEHRGVSRAAARHPRDGKRQTRVHAGHNSCICHRSVTAHGVEGTEHVHVSGSRRDVVVRSPAAWRVCDRRRRALQGSLGPGSDTVLVSSGHSGGGRGDRPGSRERRCRVGAAAPAPTSRNPVLWSDRGPERNADEWRRRRASRSRCGSRRRERIGRCAWTLSGARLGGPAIQHDGLRLPGASARHVSASANRSTVGRTAANCPDRAVPWTLAVEHTAPAARCGPTCEGLRYRTIAGERLPLGLRGYSEAFETTQPVSDPVPTGENPGHHSISRSRCAGVRMVASRRGDRRIDGERRRSSTWTAMPQHWTRLDSSAFSVDIQISSYHNMS